MKVKEILEADVVDLGKFRQQKQQAAEPDYSDASFDDEVAADIMRSMEQGEYQKNSPDMVDDEMEKRRFQKMLQNRSGQHIEAVDLVPYLRQHIPDRKEFTKFANRLLTGQDHLYTIVKYINNLFAKSGVSERVVGVSPDGEDWYISK